MTKAEARQMQRMHNEIEVLREQHAKNIRIYRDQQVDLIDLRIKLKTLAGLIGEAAAEVVK